MPLERLFPELTRLMERGAIQFKFIDRTFNLKPTVSAAILEFFLSRHRPGAFVHFEMVPDRLGEALRVILAKFPAGAVQLEVGVQTFNPEVAARIGRRQDVAKLEDNFNPVGRLYYAASTLVCVPTSLDQEVGAALGAQAGEQRLREVAMSGGFQRFRRAAETPFNLILEARP